MSRFEYIQYDQKSYETHKKILESVKELENLIETLIPEHRRGTFDGFTLENMNKSRDCALARLEEVFVHVGKAIKYDQTIVRNVPVTKLEKREKE